jgi:predicted acetyltransferase
VSLILAVQCHNGAVRQSIRFVVVDESSRPTLDRLWQLYKHDLSEFRDSQPNADGVFVTTRGIDELLANGGHEATLIYAEDQLVGFVIVGGLSGSRRDISEFFILRSWRRKGVSAKVAEAVIRRHRGSWQIAFQENNLVAARFWRSLADKLTHGVFEVELRPVPNKPHVPPDTWISFEI